MIPGQFATHNGQTVQVVRIEGGQTRGFGQLRTPTMYTLKPWPEGETYTTKDPGGDLLACSPPSGHIPPVAPTGTSEPRFYTSGKAW